MKENSGVAASVGSFFNGVIGHGILGTVDGIATAVTNPYGTVEGINNIVGDPGTAFSALKKEVGRVWDEEIINGSWEDRSRVAGAVTFEVVTTVGGAVKAGKAAKAAKAGDKAADLGTAAKAAGMMDDATGVAAKAAGVMDDATEVAAKTASMMDDAAGVAAKTAGAMDDATGMAAKAAGAMDDATGVAAKTADIMGDAAVTAQTAKKTNKLGNVIDRALTSDLAKKAANKADDFVREIRDLLNPPELKPALASGALDDADEVGFFTRHYNNRMEKNTPLQSNSGVNIQKAEIAGGAVDGTGDLGGIVKEGSGATISSHGFDTTRINVANGPTRFSPSNNAGLKHVIDRHFSPGKNAGQFNISVDELKKILGRKDVINTVGTISEESGQYVRFVDVGKDIGTIKPSIPDVGGQNTSWIAIYTDIKGNLITTYPVPPPQ